MEECGCEQTGPIPRMWRCREPYSEPRWGATRLDCPFPSTYPIHLRNGIRILDNLVSSDRPHQFGAEFLRCGDSTCLRRSFGSWWWKSYISICLTWHCAPVLISVMTLFDRCTTDCVGGFVTRLRTGPPRNRGSIPGRTKRPLHSENVLGVSWVHPSSYSVDNGGCFLGSKLAEV